MAAPSNLSFHSELLCFVQNKINSVPRDTLIGNIVAFYNSDEIVEAKAALYALSEKDEFKPASGYNPEIPRMISRRATENKKKLDATDIMDLWYALDLNMIKMPSFMP